MEILSRKSAISQGLTWYFTGKQCKNGHVDKRTIQGLCLTCKKVADKKHYAKNKEARKQWTNQYTSSHPGYRTAIMKEWRQKNREQWLTDRSIQQSKRRSRVPSWSETEKIKSLYDEARHLTETLGVDHHVDHIIPLNGKIVSGLHCIDNLQILTAEANYLKGNKY